MSKTVQREAALSKFAIRAKPFSERGVPGENQMYHSSFPTVITIRVVVFIEFLL